jgi:hypothetical protein
MKALTHGHRSWRSARTRQHALFRTPVAIRVTKKGLEAGLDPFRRGSRGI